jgi:hypothetical protein
MPTQIIELDPLVPDDIEFRYRGQKYVLPGDLTVETTFHIQKLILALNAAEQRVTDAAGKGEKVQLQAAAEQERLTLEVEKLLLGLFRQRDPDLEELPFGVVGFQHVLSMVLVKLGFGAAISEDDADPPPNRAARRKSARSKSSPPS